MIQAVLSLNGCRCISLGTQTPVVEITTAAKAVNAEIVALSFASVINQNLVTEGIAQLREELPHQTEIWVGGRNPTASRRPVAGVRMQNSLSAVRADLIRWLAEHPG